MLDHPLKTSPMRCALLRIGLTIALALVALSASADQPTTPSPSDAPRLLNVDGDGLALQGYDPVAYFVDGQPASGDPRFESTWEGAVYRFASADHKRLFDADPARYRPDFGGYCAYGASIDKLVSIDPTVFQIEDGRLLLQYDRAAAERFNADARANLDRADANWPGLVAKFGTKDDTPSVPNRVRRLLGF